MNEGRKGEREEGRKKGRKEGISLVTGRPELEAGGCESGKRRNDSTD